MLYNFAQSHSAFGTDFGKGLIIFDNCLSIYFKIIFRFAEL